jgi:hypothetical protein
MKFKAKKTFEPLYEAGDMFIIIERFEDKDLLPIRARHLRTGMAYGFEENELEEVQ